MSVALHKIGAACIPATHLLTVKDLKYRNNAADIKMIISVGENTIMDAIDESQKESKTLEIKGCIGTDRAGWVNISKAMKDESPVFHRPYGRRSYKKQRHIPAVFHLGHHGHAENGAA